MRVPACVDQAVILLLQCLSAETNLRPFLTRLLNAVITGVSSSNSICVLAGDRLEIDCGRAPSGRAEHIPAKPGGASCAGELPVEMKASAPDWCRLPCLKV